MSNEICPLDGYFNFVVGPAKIAYARKGNSIGICLLMTEQDHMGKGHARAAMSAFLAQCDQENLVVYLTPVATEKAVSKSRLRAFYASLGFHRNRLREKAFWSAREPAGHHSMCRDSNFKNAAGNSLAITVSTNDSQQKELPAMPCNNALVNQDILQNRFFSALSEDEKEPWISGKCMYLAASLHRHYGYSIRASLYDMPLHSAAMSFTAVVDHLAAKGELLPYVQHAWVMLNSAHCLDIDGVYANSRNGWTDGESVVTVIDLDEAQLKALVRMTCSGALSDQHWEKEVALAGEFLAQQVSELSGSEDDEGLSMRA